MRTKMINPINGMLLVEEEQAAEKTTKSGIVLAATYVDSGPKRGKIIAVGNGETNHFTNGTISMDVFSVGDTIVYADHTGVNIEDEDGKKYIILHHKHVMAKIS